MSTRNGCDEYGYALTAKEQLRKWDAGETIWMVSMGGLGPGYEQVIQIACMEIVRDLLDTPIPVESDAHGQRAFWAKADKALERADKFPGMGMSGAQAGAAKNLAGHLLRHGPSKAYANLKAQGGGDRMIQVSREWPRPSDASKEGGK